MGELNVPRCYSCGKEIEIIAGSAPGRRDSCPHCRADLHVCLNCRHYDSRAYNECHEVQADRVVEKERSNFCDFFSLGGEAGGDKGVDKESILKQLDGLFRS